MTVLKVGIAGLGHVGGGVFRLLSDHAGLVAARAGREIRVVAVSARDPRRERGISLAGIRWVEDLENLAKDPEIDVVVETMGGQGDPALSLIREALRSGKDVVTANKALLACHGLFLARLAEETGRSLKCEAAVAGGIPIIKILREGLAANRIQGISAILNGTCNYILTVMEESGRSFADVLAEAQEKGYAESDPSLDVDGGDTAHKLVLLAALAFGVEPDADGFCPRGIREITARDMETAKKQGCRIKLLGLLKEQEGGEIFRFVGPVLVPLSSPLAHVEGVRNGVEILSNPVGPIFVEGKGAGAGPTASAIVADLMDLAMGRRTPVFGVAAKALGRARWSAPQRWDGNLENPLVLPVYPV